jgi:hypothetical protein
MSQDKLDMSNLEVQLSRLENLLEKHREHKRERFNIFDVLRVTWLELPHSNFLAFLLNPQANHGWGNAFLKLFLKQVCGQDVEGQSFDRTEVLREWVIDMGRIDILIKDAASKLIVIIENKITSGEGEGQLEWYWKAVEAKFPDWNRVGIFLTPGDLGPTYEKYSLARYQVIANLVDKLLMQPPSIPNHDDRENVVGAVKQYSQMLRRHIVEDKETSLLCQQIFSEHHAAIDALNNYYASWLKNMESRLSAELKALITANELLTDKELFILDESNQNYIRFGMVSLERISELDAQYVFDGRYRWTKKSGRLLLFVFRNIPGYLALDLFLYHGPDEVRDQDRVRDLRARIEKLASNTLFGLSPETPWLRLYHRPILTQEDYKTCDGDAIMLKVKADWSVFLDTHFVSIKESLLEEFTHAA